jgi:hypothetical protein
VRKKYSYLRINRFLRATATVAANVKTAISVGVVNSGIIMPLKVRDKAVTGDGLSPNMNVACSSVGDICG